MYSPNNSEPAPPQIKNNSPVVIYAMNLVFEFVVFQLASGH